MQTTDATPETRHSVKPTGNLLGPPKPVEKKYLKWAREKGTPMISVSRAAIMKRWPIGYVVTEAEFDAAIEAGDNIVIR